MGTWGVAGTGDHVHGYLQFPQVVTKGFVKPSAMAGAANATTRAAAIKSFFIVSLLYECCCERGVWR